MILGPNVNIIYVYRFSFWERSFILHKLYKHWRISTPLEQWATSNKNISRVL